jgi:hypothetical protein
MITAVNITAMCISAFASGVTAVGLWITCGVLYLIARHRANDYVGIDQNDYYNNDYCTIGYRVAGAAGLALTITAVVQILIALYSYYIYIKNLM